MQRWKYILLGFLTAISANALAVDFSWDGAVPTTGLAEITQTQGLKVLWWNTHAGRANEAQPDSDFDNNLLALLQTKSLLPDIMAFAEFDPARLPAATFGLLKKTYPYSQSQVYPATKSESISVYSRYPLTVLSVDILEPGTSDARPLSLLNVDIEGKNLNFIPVHITDAWRQFASQNGDLATALEILLGDSNPVALEINDMISTLKTRLGEDYQTASTVMVGDFNQPSSIYGIPAIEYHKLSSGWKTAVSNAQPTFPSTDSQEAKSYPQMALDHGFVNSTLSAPVGLMLPLKGSDHYPLYLVVDLSGR